MQASIPSMGSMLEQGETLIFSCAVLNTGSAKLIAAAGAISSGPGIQVESVICSSVPVIPPGEAETLSWVLKAASQTPYVTVSLCVSAANHDTLYCQVQF